MIPLDYSITNSFVAATRPRTPAEFAERWIGVPVTRETVRRIADDALWWCQERCLMGLHNGQPPIVANARIDHEHTLHLTVLCDGKNEGIADWYERTLIRKGVEE